MADIQQVKKFAVLCNTKADLEADLKRIKKQLSDAEECFLKHFTAHEMQRINVEGRTLSLRREVWAKQRGDFTDADRMQLVRAAGYPELVKESVNSHTLSSLFRERASEGKDAVPSKLARCYAASECYKSSSIKA